MLPHPSFSWLYRNLCCQILPFPWLYCDLCCHFPLLHSSCLTLSSSHGVVCSIARPAAGCKMQPSSLPRCQYLALDDDDVDVLPIILIFISLLLIGIVKHFSIPFLRTMRLPGGVGYRLYHCVTSSLLYCFYTCLILSICSP